MKELYLFLAKFYFVMSIQQILFHLFDNSLEPYLVKYSRKLFELYHHAYAIRRIGKNKILSVNKNKTKIVRLAGMRCATSRAS